MTDLILSFFTVSQKHVLAFCHQKVQKSFSDVFAVALSSVEPEELIISENLFHS